MGHQDPQSEGPRLELVRETAELTPKALHGVHGSTDLDAIHRIVFDIAFRTLNNAAVASDIAGDVILELFRTAESDSTFFLRPGAVEALARFKAVTRSRDDRRAKQRLENLQNSDVEDVDALESSQPSPLHDALTGELLRVVDLALKLARIEPQCVLFFSYLHLRNWKADAVAAKYGLKKNTVKTQSSRAASVIREAILEYQVHGTIRGMKP